MHVSNGIYAFIVWVTVVSALAAAWFLCMVRVGTKADEREQANRKCRNELRRHPRDPDVYRANWYEPWYDDRCDDETYEWRQR